MPTATITYAGTPFCKSVTAAQPVTMIGTGAYAGGTFSSSPSGLTLNSSTGSITPGTSTSGSYTVFYNKSAAGGCAAFSTSTVVTITTLPAATINYPATQYCSSIAAPQTVTRTGTAGGTYSSVPAGLDIDPVTGTIIPINSDPGVYTVNYTIAASNGCPAVTATRNVTIAETPTVSMTSDYCAGGGNVRLTANSSVQPVTYLWSNGATTQSILVDKAGTYTFTATTAQGCSATSFTNVAVELVTNGDFSAGNTGFTSGYGNNQAPYTGGATGLWPETLYAIDWNANLHHPNFFGKDHTTGNGNFMIVNGAGYDTTTVWRQSFAVQPNTTYYFSAWAMSLNRVAPYAQLKFTVNDSLFGTTAVLAPGATSNTGPFNWVRFYGTWNSGSNTYITISIVDMQTAAGGNDFGLDDISFGTLSPVPFTAAPSGSACSGQTLVLNSNVTGGYIPYTYSWTGPNGFTSNAKDPVIPNSTTAHSGTYTLTVTDAYSCPVIATAAVTVGQAATVNAGPAQGVCAGGNIALSGTRGGSATSSIWSAPSGTFSSTSSLTPTYTPSITNGTVTLTLTSNDPAGICPAAVSTVVISVSNATASAGPAQSICAGSIVNLNGSIGGSATTSTWSAPSGTFSNINSLTSTYTPSITNGTVTLTLTTNNPPGPCGPATSTIVITVSPKPTVGAGGPNTVCQSTSPLPIILSGAVVGGSASTGAWSIVSGGGTLNSIAQTANPGTVSYTPAANFSGVVTLMLTTNDPAGPCIPVSSTRTITVNGLPSVNAGTYSPVCIISGPKSLSGTPAGGTFSGPGVSGNFFNPATAGTGTHTITYTYTNSNGCTNSASTSITVNPLPVVSAGTYAPVCINNGNVVLTGSPSGGIFSGPGVSGNSFNPSIAGAGTHTITLYLYQ